MCQALSCPQLPEGSLQLWKGRLLASWTSLPLRKCRVCSGRRWGAGPATLEQEWELLSARPAQAACTRPLLWRRWPRGRNPQRMSPKVPWGKPSLPGARESQQLPWRQPPSPQSLGFHCLGSPRGIRWSACSPNTPSTGVLGRILWPGGHERLSCWWEEITIQMETQSQRAK